MLVNCVAYQSGKKLNDLPVENISEYVIYMVHGKDIRHTSLDDVERELREQRPATNVAGVKPASS